DVSRASVSIPSARPVRQSIDPNRLAGSQPASVKPTTLSRSHSLEETTWPSHVATKGLIPRPMPPLPDAGSSARPQPRLPTPSHLPPQLAPNVPPSAPSVPSARNEPNAP